MSHIFVILLAGQADFVFHAHPHILQYVNLLEINVDIEKYFDKISVCLGVQATRKRCKHAATGQCCRQPIRERPADSNIIGCKIGRRFFRHNLGNFLSGQTTLAKSRQYFNYAFALQPDCRYVAGAGGFNLLHLAVSFRQRQPFTDGRELARCHMEGQVGKISSKPIVAWNSNLEEAEAAKKIEFLLLEFLDFSPAFGTGKGATEHKEKHFLKRIAGLTLLAQVVTNGKT